MKVSFLIVLIITTVLSADFNAHFLTAYQSTGALCLDGTPGLYYHRVGSGSGVNKWYIHHQGGGWCESVENCHDRSLGSLGSTKGDKQTMRIEAGYFSESPDVNPQMWNWNSVYIRYCDGASFSGNNQTSTVFNGKHLFFRGKLVLDAVIADMFANVELGKATDVVISGCSAGGLATFLHVDSWAKSINAVNSRTKVRGMPDSGWFVDYEDPKKEYHKSLIWVFNQNNSTKGVNQKCIEAFQATGDTWHCIFAEHTAPYITTPIFPLQSRFDSWQTSNDLDSDNAKKVNAYGDAMTKTIQKNLLSNPQHGIFLDSCHHHCGKWGSFKIDGKNQAEAFQAWYENGQLNKFYFQDKPFPCDGCCA